MKRFRRCSSWILIGVSFFILTACTTGSMPTDEQTFTNMLLKEDHMSGSVDLNSPQFTKPGMDLLTSDSAGATDYQVRPGDSLYRIAVNVYGNGARWRAIYAANTKLIGSNPLSIKPLM